MARWGNFITYRTVQVSWATSADIGKTIFYGLLIGLPLAIVAGPVFGNIISKYVPGNPSKKLMEQFTKQTEVRDMPGFGVTLFTVLLPVF